MRIVFRQFYQFLINRIATQSQSNDFLQRSAIVFSPHQDDETLGCGGTILQKQQAGTAVKIVFLTDGCRSHKLMAESELKSIRRREALAASCLLGLTEQDVLFLDFKDGELHKHQDAAVEKVKQILDDNQPEEVFVPYYREYPPDHWVTNKIVLSALRMYQKEVIIYEYPIWFWHHWPLTPITLRRRREILTEMKKFLSSCLSLLQDFNYSVDIRQVLAAKRTALNQHQSQMQKLIDDDDWRTLEDVANGEWLECFFHNYEVFYRHRLLLSQPKSWGS